MTIEAMILSAADDLDAAIATILDHLLKGGPDALAVLDRPARLLAAGR